MSFDTSIRGLLGFLPFAGIPKAGRDGGEEGGFALRQNFIDYFLFYGRRNLTQSVCAQGVVVWSWSANRVLLLCLSYRTAL